MNIDGIRFSCTLPRERQMRIEQHMLLLAVALANCITIQHEKETGASPDQGERTDTGADSATEDIETGETEDLDTDLSVDTAQSCENVVVDVALDDDSLGFDAGDILLAMASVTYASVRWTSLPEGAPDTERATWSCGLTPERAFIVTRIDHAGFDDGSCPPGPELYALTTCSLSMGDGGIVSIAETTVGGTTLDTIWVTLDVESVDLDPVHMDFAIADSPASPVESVDAIRLVVDGPVLEPVVEIWLQVYTPDATGTYNAWTGVLIPSGSL